jgi:hypothetical protein
MTRGTTIGIVGIIMDNWDYNKPSPDGKWLASIILKWWK